MLFDTCKVLHKTHTKKHSRTERQHRTGKSTHHTGVLCVCVFVRACTCMRMWLRPRPGNASRLQTYPPRLCTRAPRLGRVRSSESCRCKPQPPNPTATTKSKLNMRFCTLHFPMKEPPHWLQAGCVPDAQQPKERGRLRGSDTQRAGEESAAALPTFIGPLPIQQWGNLRLPVQQEHMNILMFPSSCFHPTRPHGRGHKPDMSPALFSLVHGGVGGGAHGALVLLGIRDLLGHGGFRRGPLLRMARGNTPARARQTDRRRPPHSKGVWGRRVPLLFKRGTPRLPEPSELEERGSGVRRRSSAAPGREREGGHARERGSEPSSSWPSLP